MLCKQYGCIFIHIPRTGGQSIEEFFLRLVGLDWNSRWPLLLRTNADPKLGPARLAHLTAAEYVSCGYVSGPMFKSLFKFSFVRNPWDRLVSEYNRSPRDINFKCFVVGQLSKSRMSDEGRHVMPQHDYIVDGNGNLTVDYLGRFEKLQSDFDCICQRLEISPTRLPHRNRSIAAKKHYSEYYDSELRDFVGDMYQRDVEAFGYSFD